MDLREQDILGPAINTHWYYVAKGRAMRSLLAGRSVDEALDVGAGSGIFSRQLLQAGLCRRYSRKILLRLVHDANLDVARYST